MPGSGMPGLSPGLLGMPACSRTDVVGFSATEAKGGSSKVLEVPGMFGAGQV